MKLSPHFLRMYLKTVRRYKKLSTRLKKQISNGQFQQGSEYAQKQFLHQLRKLKKKLSDLHMQLKLAAAAGATALVLSSGSVNAQNSAGPFVRQERVNNPLREPLEFGTFAYPSFADLDGDNDLDMVVGTYEDYSYSGRIIRYYKNIGTRRDPFYEEAKPEDNPLFNKLANSDRAASPSLGDLDGDGDMDAIIGLQSGEIKYFKNVGSETQPDFQEETGPWNDVEFTGNPFDALNLPGNVKPRLVDFDDDGDTDVIFASNYDFTYESNIHLYINDGDGNFSRQAVSGIGVDENNVTLATIDFDEDGDIDLVTGEKYGDIRYFENMGMDEGELVFQEHGGSDNPFETVPVGFFPAPVFVDLDNDQDYDLVIGTFTSKYGVPNVSYFENNASDFTLLEGLNSPFDGVNVGENASPTLADVNDDGLLDIIIGSDDQPLEYLRNVNHRFQEVPLEENPFAELSIDEDFTPSFIDIDGDGDKDLVGGSAYGVECFLQDEDGVFIEDETMFSSIGVDHGRSDFVDIDADGDYDLFISEYYGDSENYIRYYRNEGTAQEPNFLFQDDPFYILENVNEEHTLYPRFADIDHDGDFDALIGEGGSTVENYYSNEFLLYENVGSPESPFFYQTGEVVPQFENAIEPSPMFFDYDRDGDIDLFEGDVNGNIHYYANENPAPLTTIDATTFVSEETEGSEMFFEDLTVSDEDNDEIAQAIVRITNYHRRDTLTFEIPNLDESTPSFEFTESGSTATLTITGKASAFYYQTLLQSLTFEWDLPAGSVAPSSRATTQVPTAGQLAVEKTIRIEVRDVDATSPITRVKPLSLGIQNQPPVIDNSVSVTGVAGGSITLDLKPLISDPESPDDDLTITIADLPVNGTASIEDDKILTIDYTGLAFTGTDELRFRVCDPSNACATRLVTISVTNTAPVFADDETTTVAGGIATIDISALFSDADSNLDMTTLQITQQPGSGALATLDEDLNLIVDYTASRFTGEEDVTLQVCDITGTCVSGNITVSVTNQSPAIEGRTSTITAGGIVTIDLTELISDPDNNLVLSSLKVIDTPVSGATTSIDADNNLIINYSGLNFTGTETITVEVCDIAGVCVQNTITVNIPNTAPLLTGISASISFGGTASIALLPLIFDSENNIDPASIRVVGQPASGAVASIDANRNLIVNYTNVSFAGTEEITVEVCDLAGACGQNIFAVTVNNSAPVINAEPQTRTEGSSLVINLLNFTTDADNNLDLATFEVISQPESGAVARIVDGELIVDYTGITYQKQDHLTIRVCDAAGACTETEIVINVNVVSEVKVFNAIAPNGSSAENRYLHINGLPTNNKISIFNRWGDQVFEAHNYNNETVRFTGRNNNGNELASGSYFYKIEYVIDAGSGKMESKTVTGYLSLKQ